VLALAGCGSGHSSAGTLTKAQYDTRVSRLCALAADQFRELHLDNTLGTWKHNGSDAVRIQQHFNSALARLKPPPSIAKDAEAFVQAYEKVAKDANDAVAAAKAGDRGKLLAALAAGNNDDLATYSPAKAIGATGCYIS
jgi:hypothetical protein